MVCLVDEFIGTNVYCLRPEKEQWQSELRKKMTFINPFTVKCGQRQISTKIPNFIFYSFDKQIASCESTDRELSFEWSHHRISSTHSKGRVTLQNSIKHFGSERVKKVTNGNNKYCGTSRKRPLKIRRFSARLRKVVAYEYPTRGWISF